MNNLVLDTRKLEYLESIYRTGSFTAAARECFVSQPNITKGINALEQELGIELISRRSGKIKFTEAGERFMPYAQAILRETRAAAQEMDQLRRQQGESLTIGLSVLSSVWLSSMLYTDFARKHPYLKVTHREMPMQEMLRSLDEGMLDMVFSPYADNLDSALYDVIPLMRCELKLYMGINHPLARYASVPFEMLDGQTVLAYPENALIRMKMDEQARLCRIKPVYMPKSMVSQVNEGMIRCGKAVVCEFSDRMSEMIAPQAGIQARGFQNPIFFREGLIVRRGMITNQKVQAVKKYIQQQIAAQDQEEEAQEALAQ